MQTSPCVDLTTLRHPTPRLRLVSNREPRAPLTAQDVGAPADFDLMHDIDGALPIDDSLRWARWLEARQRHDDTALPQPDLPEGDCSECARTTTHRWTHGQAHLCLDCLRRRLRVLAVTSDSNGISSAIQHAERIAFAAGPYHGECQRCPPASPHTTLELEHGQFLCPTHAKRSRQAKRRRKERDAWPN